MHQTLLTGFGSFGPVIRNPTERLLRHFAGQVVGSQELTVCWLPVSFARAGNILRAAIDAGGRDGKSFDDVLMLGVAARSVHWNIERVGRNWDANPMPDADGFTTPARSIIANGPMVLSSTFPAENILTAFYRAGLPAVFSDSAGEYLCNHVLYTALEHLRQSGTSTRAGFLHIPSDEETFAPGEEAGSPFPFKQHILAVRLALEALETDKGAVPDLERESVP